jgi:hypothetical protein
LNLLIKDQTTRTIHPQTAEYKGISKNNIFIERWPSCSVFEAQNKPKPQSETPN